MHDIEEHGPAHDQGHARLTLLESQVRSLRLGLFGLVIFAGALFLAWLLPPLQLPLFIFAWCAFVMTVVVGFIRCVQLLLGRVFDRSIKPTHDSSADN